MCTDLYFAMLYRDCAAMRGLFQDGAELVLGFCRGDARNIDQIAATISKRQL